LSERIFHSIIFTVYHQNITVVADSLISLDSVIPLHRTSSITTIRKEWLFPSQRLDIS